MDSDTQHQRPTSTSKYREAVIGLDPITGIANRRLFEYQGEKAFSMAQRHNDDLGLVVFRLENLEAIANRDGMPQAKQLLQTIASQLSENARVHDTTGRLSRSRFGVLLPGAREFGAHKFAVRLLSVLRDANDTQQSCVLSAAATATNSRSCDRFRELHDHASQRLDDAVSAGGNRLVSSFCQ
jgi:diguanylate cyclase (GGDEF)-like protein